MDRSARLAVAIVALVAAAPPGPEAAFAAIYKSRDAAGHVSYSDEPGPGAVPVALPQLGEISHVTVAVTSGAAQPAAAPCGPLGAELATQEQELTSAEQALRAGEEEPEVYRTTVTGPGGAPHKVIRRAYARYQEKVARLEDEVERHQERISSLRREMAAQGESACER